MEHAAGSTVGDEETREAGRGIGSGARIKESSTTQSITDTQRSSSCTTQQFALSQPSTPHTITAAASSHGRANHVEGCGRVGTAQEVADHTWSKHTFSRRMSPTRCHTKHTPSEPQPTRSTHTSKNKAPRCSCGVNTSHTLLTTSHTTRHLSYSTLRTRGHTHAHVEPKHARHIHTHTPTRHNIRSARPCKKLQSHSCKKKKKKNQVHTENTPAANKQMASSQCG